MQFRKQQSEQHCNHGQAPVLFKNLQKSISSREENKEVGTMPLRMSTLLKPS